MNTSNLIKISIVALGMVCFTACSTTKSKNADFTGSDSMGTQTSGLGEQGKGFGDDEYGPNNPNRLKAPYNQTYRFEFNKYEVQQEDVASINVQANYLASHSSAKVRLEGNADERGSREYNVALGWKRAKAVAEILKQQGVSASQIAMVSYGKEKPVATGHDEDAYRLNRRVELVYESK
jgi:peptidoglycan-associated lipoprotein